MFILRTIFFSFITLFPIISFAADDTEVGKKCFDQYAALAAQYDPQAISMINDNAVIVGIAPRADGTTQKSQMSGVEYKRRALINLPRLKQIGESHAYQNIAVKMESGKYRITGTDYSSAAKITVQFSSLFELDTNKNCKVAEVVIIFPGSFPRLP